jgi:K+-transporting ATPase ATPase A chain
MNVYDWQQLVLFFAVLLLLVKPFGAYMAKVYQGEQTLLSPLLAPCEGLIYRITGVAPSDEMDWRRYAGTMLLFNLLGFLVLFLLLLTQHFLPLNPEQFSAFSWPLAFNTAVSFTTNTNWQNYGGESTASYLSQMAGFTVQNFLSAATGMVIAIATIRGFIRRRTQALGNFWVDMVRSVLYILLPISLVAALILVSQGVIQNFQPYRSATLVESATVTDIPMGPVASQEAIKELGTNGGGFLNANSSHPFENPTPLTNFLEVLLILLIPASLTFTFGKMAGDTRQGWALLAAMLFLFLVALAALQWMEVRGNPQITAMGVTGGNMEGKEVRFGLTASSLFAAATTATSCGAVNTMHDSLTPLGGMMPLSLILTGEVIFGGVGSGLYTMLAFAVVAVFVSGLMIGRTPEYLGKKIEVRVIWMSVVAILTAGVLVLILSGVAMLVPQAVASMTNPGAHGLSEVLYAFASMANNNGSAFAGLNGNTNFYNLVGALAMLGGRFIPAVAVLAMAGSLAEKKYVPPSLGTLPTSRAPFVIWLVLVIIIVGALTFFPVLALGPIVEHLLMSGGN